MTILEERVALGRKMFVLQGEDRAAARARIDEIDREYAEARP